MPYRTIMLLLDARREAYHRLAIAAQLAVRHDALLIGMLAQPPLPPARDGTSHDASEQARRDREEDAEVMRHAFNGETEHLPIATQWHRCAGDPLAIAEGEARLADLLVVGQQDQGDAQMAVPKGFVEAMIMGSGRPVLVIPAHGWFATVGTRVLVAWNGSREAARALHDALPLLQQAKSVMLVSCAESRPDAAVVAHRTDGRPTSMARYPQEWLQRQGIRAGTIPLAYLDGGDVGERLLSLAADENMDLIVAGAYGHSRVREQVLGGVTRTLLRSMTVPVLFSH
ncbi:universal stress protein [Cupriavidus respiraculi]|uniref:UspA domain-containing protein n=1 Tax=Cupriavidus respiraculi TaxID=195930 RepID=A0ABM8WGS6_9BURK|nr:universal stress protein [Cupriavidus respiraculi]CAG9166566.1 hypothetical protein LMG21510_00433 [Cupriavidus respiraculi]